MPAQSFCEISVVHLERMDVQKAKEKLKRGDEAQLAKETSDGESKPGEWIEKRKV